MKGILVAGILMALVVFAGRAERPGSYARRVQCMNNLKQIAMALEDYHRVYNAFPPAFVADETGRPMHSWRVLILPFLEQQSLYDQFVFSEPWDGPNNIKLLGMMPQFFDCPSRNTLKPSTLTSYVVVTGPGTMFPGAESSRLDQVTDGPDNSIMVVEVVNVRIPWTKPQDLDLQTMSLQINDEKHPAISSDHAAAAGASVAFGDASCRRLDGKITASQLRSLFTIAGDETISRACFQ